MGAPEYRPALQKQIVRSDVPRTHRLRKGPSHQGYLQRLDYRPCDLILYLEQIIELSFVRFRPKMIAVVSTDELCGDAEVIARFTNAPLQHVCNAQRLCDVRNRYLLAFEVE